MFGGQHPKPRDAGFSEDLFSHVQTSPFQGMLGVIGRINRCCKGDGPNVRTKSPVLTSVLNGANKKLYTDFCTKLREQKICTGFCTKLREQKNLR